MIVTCNGCFDGIHPGHLFFLGFCRGLCIKESDAFIVGINSDDYIRRKKREPFYNQIQRRDALLSLGFIDEVVNFNEDTPDEFIKQWKSGIHCTGEEYGVFCAESKTCLDIGTKLVLIPRIPILATSNMDKPIKEFTEYFMKEASNEKLSTNNQYSIRGS